MNVLAILATICVSTAQDWASRCNEPVTSFDKSAHVAYYPESMSRFARSKSIRNWKSYEYYATFEVRLTATEWRKYMTVRCGTEDPTTTDSSGFADTTVIYTPIKKIGLTMPAQVALFDKGVNTINVVGAYYNPEKPLEGYGKWSTALSDQMPEISTWDPEKLDGLNETGLSVVIVPPESLAAYQDGSTVPAVPWSVDYEFRNIRRLTWLDFAGLLTDKLNDTAVFWGKMKSSYGEVRSIAVEAEYMPSIWLGTATDDAWSFPNSGSTEAELAVDANLYYVFGPKFSPNLSPEMKAIGEKGSIPNTPEAIDGPGATAVYAKGSQFYFPMAGYADTSVSQAINRNSKVDLSSWRSAKCQGGMIGASQGGSPSRMEYDSILYPEDLLKDLVVLTHPELLGRLRGHELVYLQALNGDDGSCTNPAKLPAHLKDNGKSFVTAVYNVTGIRREVFEAALYDGEVGGPAGLLGDLKSQLNIEDMTLGFATIPTYQESRLLLRLLRPTDVSVGGTLLKLKAMVDDTRAAAALEFVTESSQARITSWLRSLKDSTSGATAELVVKTIDGVPDSPDSDSTSGNLSGGSIAGIVIGCVVGFIALVAVLMFLLFKRYKKNKEAKVPLARVETPKSVASEAPTGAAYAEI